MPSNGGRGSQRVGMDGHDVRRLTSAGHGTRAMRYRARESRAVNPGGRVAFCPKTEGAEKNLKPSSQGGYHLSRESAGAAAGPIPTSTSLTPR